MRSIGKGALFLFALQLSAQAPPRRTECLQWDQAYAQTVLMGIIGAASLACLFALLIGFAFGRRLWPMTLARTRIWIGGAVALLLVEFVIVAWPRILPLGRFPYASLDPRYADCQTMAFGAPGLLGGAVGRGVAAYAQWQAITVLLIGAAFLGALLAWIFSEWLLRTRGLEALARAGETS